MTAIDRHHAIDHFSANRQLHSTRPDIIRKITALKQRLAALESVLASSAEPDAFEAPGAPEPLPDHINPNAAAGFVDATPSSRLRRSGTGAVRMRQA